MKKKKVNTRILVDIVVPLEENMKAVDMVKNKKEEVFKAVFVPKTGHKP
jgi:hypothetical protein